ncbi:hypothetical protein [Brevundimonas sp.]|uniref:hypothetical protein n=1 Tax=Brevundimonas sp. TaxID=1871086 RepID=UPI002FC96AFE
MVKIGGGTVLAAAAVMVLAGCARVESKVHERVASPDGSKEAVVMTCPQASDPAVPVLVGAIFDTKGQGCKDATVDGLSYFIATMAPDGDGAGTKVVWDGSKAIFDIEGERYVISRGAKSNVALDMIQLKGSFDGADIVDED